MVKKSLGRIAFFVLVFFAFGALVEAISITIQYHTSRNVFEEIYVAQTKLRREYPREFAEINTDTFDRGILARSLAETYCEALYKGPYPDKQAFVEILCYKTPRKQIVFDVYKMNSQGKKYSNYSVTYDFDTQTLSSQDTDGAFVFDHLLPAWFEAKGASSNFSIESLGKFTDQTPQNTPKGAYPMKRTLIIVAAMILAPAIVLGGIYAAFFVFPRHRNQAILDDMTAQFVDILTSMDGVTVVETKTVYGKLNGNGNGIQYFGAALLTVDPARIPAILAALEQTFECAEGWEQTGQAIVSHYLEHRSLAYDTAISAEEETSYVTICFFNSQHPDSIEWDIAGH